MRRLPKGGELALALKGDRATIVSGTASFDLRTLPLVDFPQFRETPDDAVTFDVPCTDLKRLINETVYATHQGTMARLFERGIYLHVAGNKLLAAATDSHRLALASADMPRGSGTMPGVVVPADAAQAIAQLLGDREGDVMLTVSPRMFEVRLGKVRLSTVHMEKVDTAPARMTRGWKGIHPPHNQHVDCRSRACAIRIGASTAG